MCFVSNKLCAATARLILSWGRSSARTIMRRFSLITVNEAKGEMEEAIERRLWQWFWNGSTSNSCFITVIWEDENISFLLLNVIPTLPPTTTHRVMHFGMAAYVSLLYLVLDEFLLNYFQIVQLVHIEIICNIGNLHSWNNYLNPFNWPPNQTKNLQTVSRRVKKQSLAVDFLRQSLTEL